MKNREQFYQDLLSREASNKWDAIEKRKGNHYGAFQMGKGALDDLGYYDIKNDKWNGKDGINSLEDFLHNPEIQQKAIEAYHQLIWERQNFSENIGQKIGGVTLDKSGIIAAAHLVGDTRLKNFFKKGGVGEEPQDSNGVLWSEYATKFGNYNLNNSGSRSSEKGQPLQSAGQHLQEKETAQKPLEPQPAQPPAQAAAQEAAKKQQQAQQEQVEAQKQQPVQAEAQKQQQEQQQELAKSQQAAVAAGEQHKQLLKGIDDSIKQTAEKDQEMFQQRLQESERSSQERTGQFPLSLDPSKNIPAPDLHIATGLGSSLGTAESALRAAEPVGSLNPEGSVPILGAHVGEAVDHIIEPMGQLSVLEHH